MKERTREKARRVKERTKAKARRAKIKVKAKVKEKMPDDILFKIIFLGMGFSYLLLQSLFT